MGKPPRISAWEPFAVASLSLSIRYQRGEGAVPNISAGRIGLFKLGRKLVFREQTNPMVLSPSICIHTHPPVDLSVV